MYYCRVTFLNQFFERLSTQSTARNWVDIENAYYKELVALLSETDEEKRKKDVVTLNKEFTEVKTLLERYLSKVVEESTSIKSYDSIDDALCCPVHLEEIACGKQQMVFNSILAAIYSNDDNYIVEKEMEGKSVYDGPSDVLFALWKQYGERWRYAKPTETLLLNFNYTNTVTRLYYFVNHHSTDPPFGQILHIRSVALLAIEPNEQEHSLHYCLSAHFSQRRHYPSTHPVHTEVRIHYTVIGYNH